MVAPLRIATRRSAQARTQAQHVADALASSGVAPELVLVDTGGDIDKTSPLHELGGMGVFAKEVQQAVLDGRADVAVHSAKDLPTESVAGLTIGAFCARRDPADALVGAALAELEPGATIATGSVRRRAQLRMRRPDLQFVELRGNIHTRLERIPDGGAIVMAVTALDLLDLSERIAERLDPSEFVPSPGQGCVAVEHRLDDHDVAAIVAQVDDAPSRHAVCVERAFLGQLGSGCSLPVGAYVDEAVLHTFLSDDAVLVVDQRRTVLSLDGTDEGTARDVAMTAMQAIGRR